MDFLNFKLLSKFFKKMSLMSYFLDILFHFQQCNFFGKIVLTFVWNINILLLVLYGSLESSSQFFEFRRCHFYEHDGMLRELFYCLWRGANMSMACVQDLFVLIYIFGMWSAKTWQRNPVIRHKKPSWIFYHS